MNHLFMMLAQYAEGLGELKRADLYDKEFASLTFEIGNISYSVTIRCEYVEEEENNGN